MSQVSTHWEGVGVVIVVCILIIVVCDDGWRRIEEVDGIWGLNQNNMAFWFLNLQMDGTQRLIQSKIDSIWRLVKQTKKLIGRSLFAATDGSMSSYFSSAVGMNGNGSAFIHCKIPW